MVTPYYSEGGIEIYLGDCREILPGMSADAIITDPVWPNSIFPKVLDPLALLEESLAYASADRVVVQLGCDSDPRFLAAVPRRWPFIRVCVLDYAKPSYKGRLIYGGDIAYVFGAIPKTGRKLIPGLCISTRHDSMFRRSNWNGPAKRFNRTADNAAKMPHPAPRRLQHVQWLCKWFGGASVIDPFMGSGTAALACRSLGIKFTGIEIEERFCALAAKRLSQQVMDFGPSPETQAVQPMLEEVQG